MLINTSAHTSQALSLDALNDYVAAIEDFSAGNIAAALDRAAWLVESFGLSNQPDAVLLVSALKNRMPQGHPDYSDSLDFDSAENLYKHRNNRGQLRDAANRSVRKSATDPSGRTRQVSANIPVVNGMIRWPLFAASWPLAESPDFIGAWALTLVGADRYAEADEVLATALGTSSLIHAARMALYLETQRWGDLRDAAAGARSAASASGDEMLGDIATACLGMADASLGSSETARMNLEVAQRSKFIAVSAWAYYIDGLLARTAYGDEDGAKNLLSKSLSLNHTTWADAASGSPERKLRVSSESNIAERTDRWDVTTEPDPEMERQRTVAANQDTYRAQAKVKLDRQIGMENVKSELARVTTSIRVARERIRRGADPRSMNYNLVLTGPPGTGKSTIVEAFALQLAAEGIVDDPEPMITGKADFVADVVGGSVNRTKETIAKAKGRVLFIDEFYSIVQGDKASTSQSNTDSFGMEAIDTLVGEMETKIGETVFIVAGYAGDIDRIMRVNDGLASRFPRRIAFESFTLEQLAAVAEKEADDKGVYLSADAAAFLADENGPARKLMLQADQDKRIIDVLGNGRFARNVVDRAIEEQSLRLASDEVDLSRLSDADLNTLAESDVKAAFDAYLHAELHGKGTSV